MILVVCTACAGTFGHPPEEHRTWTEHVQDAQKHDDAAAVHEQAADEIRGSFGPYAYDCGNTTLNDQLTTAGGVRVTSFQPCWNIEEEAAAHHRLYALHGPRS